MVSLCCCRSSRTATWSLSSWRWVTGTRRIATRDSRGPGLNITTAYRFRCKFKRIWNASEFLFNSSEEKKAESCLLINLHPLRLFSVVVRVGTGEAARLPSLRLQVWVLCFKLGGWWLLPAAGGARLGRVNCIQMRLRCQWRRRESREGQNNHWNIFVIYKYFIKLTTSHSKTL